MGIPTRSLMTDLSAEDVPAREPKPFEELYMIGVPSLTYRALSDAAAKRNMTLQQLVSLAFNRVLEK